VVVFPAAKGLRVFADLLGILRNRELENKLAVDLAQLIDDSTALVITGGEFFWGKEVTQEGRLKLYGSAEEVADRHRAIRNLFIVHSPLATSTDRAHFLGMISLIREVERLVERAKNLVELARMGGAPLPDDALVHELQALRRLVEAQLDDVPRTVKQNDARRAQQLEDQGRQTILRLDLVVERVARSNYSPAHAIQVGLGARVYARIQRQLLNIVQSLITPLHLVDFFEERGPEESAPPPSVR
jgi:hypothetical protein